MTMIESKQVTRRHAGAAPRMTAALTALALAGSLVGCSGRSEPPPPVDDTALGARRAPPAPPVEEPRHGMSTGTKMVILGGAAALYYMYRKHQNSTRAGEEGQYYLSKNGRVYYRDAEHRAHWVTPPPQGIPVPESEAREYAPYQGYNNQQTGRDLSGLSTENP